MLILSSHYVYFVLISDFRNYCFCYYYMIVLYLVQGQTKLDVGKVYCHHRPRFLNLEYHKMHIGQSLVWKSMGLQQE